ncbi:modulator of apoptosis 1-like [Mobula hypostoma]|uniref:modulator of apoptosis 1-like n=1 Tax=Mobula hypostoma TaxID=723540 RepID=UPI002FC275D0
MLSGVDFHTLEEVLVRGLSQIKSIGKVELTARRCGKEVESSWVLVRTSADIMTLELPVTVSVPGEVGPWGLHTLPEDECEETPEEELDETPGKMPLASDGGLKEFAREQVLGVMREEEQEGSEWEGLVRPRPPARGETSELAIAMTFLVRRAEGPRPLRIFSGTMPTLEGEDDYETWIENTSQLLGDWPGSDEEKRQRLVESLRGVAAGVVRGLKAEQPSTSLAEYLEALEGAFGLMGGSWKLLGELQNMRQGRGEKLSEYIFRLEVMLNGLWCRGVVKADEVARWMNQISRGSLGEDQVALSLWQSYKRSPPPSFSQLIREVREDESALGRKEDSGSRGRPSAVQEVVAGLRAERPKRSQVDPVETGGTALLVGTNSPPVRRLLGACKEKVEENFLETLSVHPVF